MGQPPKNATDEFIPGDWNAVCFECGIKKKASFLKKHWQGYYVCPKHWETRHPQDFVKAIPDDMSVPWEQPEPDDVFVSFSDFIVTLDQENIATEDGNLFIME